MMQAIIMAAGKGSRIGDKADGLPKCYLKINSESLIERQLRLLREAGIKDIVIVTGYQKERFETDFAAKDVTFAFNPFFETANVLSSYWCAKHLLTEDTIYMHADTIYTETILAKTIAEPGDIVLPVDYKSCVDEDMKVKTVGSEVVEINKTMESCTADGEFIGLAKLSKSILASLAASAERLLAAKKFDAFVEMAFQDLADRKEAKLSAISTDGELWKEIDFSEDYQEAQRLFSS